MSNTCFIPKDSKNKLHSVLENAQKFGTCMTEGPGNGLLD